jgi:hydrogenase/urease accessory protein HupE
VLPFCWHGGSGLELALSLTLIVAGVAFFAGRIPKAAVVVAATSSAGFLHGFAHGSQVLPVLPFIGYAAGFLAGIAVLLGTGAAINAAVSHSPLPVARMVGGAMVAVGFMGFLQAL